MKELLEKLKKIIIEPQPKIFFDDMEDETGMNIQEEMSFGQLGTTPTPNMGRKDKSVKELKKELEELEEEFEAEYDGYDAEFYDHIDPVEIFLNDPQPEYDEALELLQNGIGKDDRIEYQKFLDFFTEYDKSKEFIEYAASKGYDLWELSPENINESIQDQDDQVITELDKIGFKPIKSDTGYKYIYEGNYVHLIYFNKEKQLIKYHIYEDESPLYENTWLITPQRSVKDIFNQIGKVLDRYE